MSRKDKERWKRLEALGAKGEIPTPEGEAKMSAVIIQLAEPLLKQHATNAKRAETIISLTVAAWNKSMFPPDKQPIIEKELIMDTVAERREELFPDLRNVIVDHEVDISGDQLNLNVTSAPVPDIG